MIGFLSLADQMVKTAYNARDLGSIPGEGNGSPLQYSCLEKPMDREAWRATAPKRETQLRD